MSNSKEFNVFDMANSYAAENNLTDVNDLFGTSKTSESSIPTSEPVPEQQKEVEPVVEDDNEIPVMHTDDDAPDASAEDSPKVWSPDEDLISDMKEISSTPVTYTREELVEKKEDLKNIVDDEALEESRRAMDDMSRKLANIEDAKHRHGISKLKIPEGELQTKILIAASDPSYKVAKAKLDEIFNMIKLTYPNFIYEWESDYKDLAMKKEIARISAENPDAVRGEGILEAEKIAKQNLGFNNEGDDTVEGTDPAFDLKIIIDKSNLDQISWNQDEIDKIRKSRTIELNIVESKDIEMSQIKDIPDNMIDTVLQSYVRKTNDIVAVLPASKYKCTFTGLSYPEVLDLSNSTELDNLDGERKKWSICFNHIKNQSIGPWEEYQLYTDPATGEEKRIGFTDSTPEGIPDSAVHVVSKFEDFLRKTSHVDLDFMLWKIICATTMDEEIITIDCKTLLSNGDVCGKTYDWIYRPAELLQMDKINPAILEDIEKTAKCAGSEEIMANYNSSLVKSESVITLNSSGFGIVFGHASAYVYLDSIYSAIESLQNDDDEIGIISKGFNYILLTIVKAVLVPDGKGGYGRISGVDKLIKVLNSLNEVDWLTLQKLVTMVIDPYEFKFMIKDLVCPHCKHRSNLIIKDMTNLLFIVTQSLSSVDVTFKKM